MRRYWGAVLGLLWVHGCCEWGHRDQGWGAICSPQCVGSGADTEVWEGPTSSWLWLGIFYRFKICIGNSPVISSVYVFLFLAVVTGMKVEQSPSALSLQEGASSILKCNYSSAVRSVQWFRQNPGGGSLTRLFYIASGMKQSGRLNCTLNAKERFSTLHVAASQLEDSATYLCAVEAQCSLVICSLPPNCRWACSTSTSLGRAFAPTAACAVLQFSFLLQ